MKTKEMISFLITDTREIAERLGELEKENDVLHEDNSRLLDRIADYECRIAELEKQLSEPPQPKAPTFKDKFLEAFPKTKIEEGIPKVCVEDIFPWVKYPRCNGKNCDKCWSQPYFEEEGGKE